MAKIKREELSGQFLKAFDKIVDLKNSDDAKQREAGLKGEKTLIKILESKKGQAVKKVVTPKAKATPKKGKATPKKAKATSKKAKATPKKVSVTETNPKGLPFATRVKQRADKDGITFREARVKLSKEIQDEKDKIEATIKEDKKKALKELEKLTKAPEFQQALSQFPKKSGGKKRALKSNVSADGKRQALPRGKRISQGKGANQYGKAKKGKVYYEYRDNRSDVNSVPTKAGQYKYKGKTPPYLEAGGTLPTPFGQAGLVGETGTLNEVDLFAMGGGLPQGVHQYYAQTYNPAYPTPHGYAKGGLTDSKYIPSEEIYEVVTKDGKVYENDYSEMEFLSGAYVSDKVVSKSDEDKSQMSLFKKGGKLPKGAIYIKRRDIDYITIGDEDDRLDEGDKEKVSGKNLFNGFWIDPKKQKTLIAEAKNDGRLNDGSKPSKEVIKNEKVKLEISKDTYENSKKITYSGQLFINNTFVKAFLDYSNKKGLLGRVNNYLKSVRAKYHGDKGRKSTSIKDRFLVFYNDGQEQKYTFKTQKEAQEFVKIVNGIKSFTEGNIGKIFDKGGEIIEQFAKGGDVTYTDTKKPISTTSFKIWENYKNINNQQSVGSFSHNYNKRNVGDYYLFLLDDYDRNFYSHIPLKPNEMLFRSETETGRISKSLPLIKINLQNGRIYFMSDDNDINSDYDDKNPKFQKASADVNYLSLDDRIKKYNQGLITLDELSESINKTYAKGGALNSLKNQMNDDLEIHSEYYAEGGMIEIDEDGGNIPSELMEVFSDFNEDEDSYKEMERLRLKAKEIGYDFDYDLSGQPTEFMKIDTYAKGGGVKEGKYKVVKNWSHSIEEGFDSKKDAIDFSKKYTKEQADKGHTDGGTEVMTEVEWRKKSIEYYGDDGKNELYAKGGDLERFRKTKQHDIYFDFTEFDKIDSAGRTQRRYEHPPLSYETTMKMLDEFKKQPKKYIVVESKKNDDGFIIYKKLKEDRRKKVMQFRASQSGLYAKGGRTISIVNDGVKYDKSKYKAVYGDYDKDGVVNIDDANPLNKNKKGKVEEIELKNTFDKLLGVKAELDTIMYDAVDTLDEKAPKGADIYARTKTPYSILKKLVEKRMLDPKKGLTDMIGTTIAVDNQKELVELRDKIDNGLLGKVLDRDDFYKRPNAGYRAYHYIVEYKGVPVEVQLKTKNMKKLHEVSHKVYKNGNLDAKSLDFVSKTFMKADKGDSKAKAEIDRLLKDKKQLISKITKD
jgi:ppGpp synthetase/RelA/SpoT-type nucleotidyltranferase